MLDIYRCLVAFSVSETIQTVRIAVTVCVSVAIGQAIRRAIRADLGQQWRDFGTLTVWPDARLSPNFRDNRSRFLGHYLVPVHH